MIRNTNFNADGTLDDSDIASLEVEVSQFAKRSLRSGDIILEKSGGGQKQAVGRVIYFNKEEGDYSFSNFTARVRSVNPAYLSPLYLHRYLYWLYALGKTEPIQSHSTGIRNLNLNAYKALTISFPPFKEQERIVAILDQAFAGLAAAKANADAALLLSKDLLNNAIDYLIYTPASGWSNTSLGLHIDLLTGFPFTSQTYTDSDGDIRLLRGDNIVQGVLRWREVKRWPASDTKGYANYQLCEDDVVLAMDRTWVKAGLKYAVLSSEDLPCLLVQRVARMRAQGGLTTTFLKWLIASQRFADYILSVQTGSGVPHISGDQIRAFSFRLPTVREQLSMTAILDELSAHVLHLKSVYEQKLTALAALKQSLLHQAFSGNL